MQKNLVEAKCCLMVTILLGWPNLPTYLPTYLLEKKTIPGS